MTLSRPLAAVLVFSETFRGQIRHHVDGSRDLALFHLLDCMTCYDTTFDLGAHVEGLEHVTRVLDAGRGGLVVGVHSQLNLMTPRVLHDLGSTPLMVAAWSDIRIAGTGITGYGVLPTPAFMLRLRSWWRRGGLVCAMLDNADPSKRAHTTYDTPLGRNVISHSLLRLATRFRVPVVFATARADAAHGLVITFGAPDDDAGDDVDRIAHEFVAFLRRHATRVAERV
ncbi:MAG: hypothetical protein ACREXX_00495 [Gammaproteobacteria bacterium]